MAEIAVNSMVQHPDYDLTFRVLWADPVKQQAEIQCEDILGLRCSFDRLTVIETAKPQPAGKNKNKPEKPKKKKLLQ